MNWSHPSLETPAEYSVGNGRVLKGCTIIAYYRAVTTGGYVVAVPGGRKIGHADTPAQAMLMAIRQESA